MILQLYQISVDLAILVEIQGKRMDNIEVIVKNSKEFVDKGTNEMKQAEEIQKSNRKVNTKVIIHSKCFLSKNL